MSPESPFGPADLAELDSELLARAFAVVAMQDVHAGNRSRDAIAMRHDVDNANGSLETAVNLALWEAARHYRSTYYVLHTSDYWRDEPRFRAALETIALGGHEIGLHANAVAHALRAGGDPAEIVFEALERLRAWGHPVLGVVGHGDQLCPEVRFANDEMFVGCERPSYGDADRDLEYEGRTVRLAPQPLASFGLKYEAVRLGRVLYNTDSNGRWYYAFDETVDAFNAPSRVGQLHLVVHPDWWGGAFREELKAA